MSTPRYRSSRIGGCLHASVETRPDGAVVLRSKEPLQPYAARLTDRLERHAAEAPERILAARRGPDGQWVTIGYAQMLDRVRRIGQTLASRPLSPERPIAILSGNDLEHLTLALAAQWVGVPFAPISPADSTVSQERSNTRMYETGPEARDWVPLTWAPCGRMLEKS